MEQKEFTIEPGKSFQANGKTYTASTSFQIGRMEKVEELEEELLVFGKKQDCHAVMLKAMELINQYKPGDAYTMMYNKIESDQRNAKFGHYMLRMCAAYINFDGEDTRYLTDEMIKAKVSDWSEEGLPAAPFFVFGLNVYRELFENYKQPILRILEQLTTVKEAFTKATDIKSLLMEIGPDEV